MVIPSDASQHRWNHKALISLNLFFGQALRAAVLLTTGYVLYSSISTLRSYLHLREINTHRLTIASGLAAFMEAARTDTQRDAILAQVIGAVIAHGESGLVSGKRDQASSDDLPKIITALSGLLSQKG